MSGSVMVLCLLTFVAIFVFSLVVTGDSSSDYDRAEREIQDQITQAENKINRIRRRW